MAVLCCSSCQQNGCVLLSTMSSSLICETCTRILFFTKAEKYPNCCIEYVLFVYSWINGHLGYFSLLALVDKLQWTWCANSLLWACFWFFWLYRGRIVKSYMMLLHVCVLTFGHVFGGWRTTLGVILRAPTLPLETSFSLACYSPSKFHWLAVNPMDPDASAFPVQE